MNKPITKEVRLFKLGEKSSRGYFFSRSAFEKFLKSKQCKERLTNRTALGTITHFGRKTPDNPMYSKGIPTEDILLIERNYTHFSTDLYIDEEGYACTTIQLLDPELFEGETKEKIAFITGLIQSGVNLTTSAGIDAWYHPTTKEGTEIYDFLGVDFTNSPDFNKSGIK